MRSGRPRIAREGALCSERSTSSESFYVAELTVAEDIESELLDCRGWRIARWRSGGQEFRLQSDCGMRFSREHFLDRKAELAGKIALKLLRAVSGGDAAFGLHGAIEAAVDFVKKCLAGF